MRIDILEKFAKTSQAAEALLAESKQDQKRELKVSSKYRRQQRIKFEDTNMAYADSVLDPKLPA
jgi:hypothetical protein